MLMLPDDKRKPMRVVLGGLGDEEPKVLRIYAWNVTHGGGSARAAGEYRIQLTGEMPDEVEGETTIVLGWSAKFQIFAGWDASKNIDRTSSSPSLQVREATLVAANSIGLAAALRSSEDVVVAFRAEMLATYCLHAPEIHDDTPTDISALLNAIPIAVEQDDQNGHPALSVLVSGPRQRIARIVETSYRSWDFANRVKSAYHDLCAVCSIQLGLTEAAHIVPVAWPGSTDLTSNGLSLCRNHHRAYDANLLSVKPDYTIEISKVRGASLSAASLDRGLIDLMSFDGAKLAVVPDSVADRPLPEYLQVGRDARRWMA